MSDNRVLILSAILVASCKTLSGDKKLVFCMHNVIQYWHQNTAFSVDAVESMLSLLYAPLYFKILGRTLHTGGLLLYKDWVKDFQRKKWSSENRTNWTGGTGHVTMQFAFLMYISWMQSKHTHELKKPKSQHTCSSRKIFFALVVHQTWLTNLLIRTFFRAVVYECLDILPNTFFVCSFFITDQC